jgi:hypothetical protein
VKKTNQTCYIVNNEICTSTTHSISNPPRSAFQQKRLAFVRTIPAYLAKFNENFKCQNQLPQLIWSFSHLQMLVYNLHIYGPLHARKHSPRSELTHSLVPKCHTRCHALEKDSFSISKHLVTWTSVSASVFFVLFLALKL